MVAQVVKCLLISAKVVISGFWDGVLWQAPRSAGGLLVSLTLCPYPHSPTPSPLLTWMLFL